MSCTDTEIDLQQYPASWKLAPIGPTRRQPDALLTPVESAFGTAMLKRVEDRQHLATSTGLLRWYQGSGSANTLKKRNDTQLLEWIDGPALSQLVKDAKEEQAIDTLSKTVKKLHASRPEKLKTRLTPLSSTMRPLLEQKFSDNLVHRHAARLMRHLLQTTEKRTPLHGDLHFDKILHHSKRGWLTIAPHGISGDPHYELASALCDTESQSDLRRVRERIQARAHRLAKNLSLNRDRLLTHAFCHACLKHLYAERDGDNARHWQEMSITLLDSLVP